LEIHHLVHREHGGSHEPSNLTLRCSACHAAHHAGKLLISGTAPHGITTVRVEAPRGETAVPEPAALPSRRLDEVILVTQARDALVASGWKAGVARAAVEEARAHVGASPSLEDLIREAFRRCPRPGT
jgi:hypothetical protein